MAHETLTLDELRGRPLEEVLKDIADHRSPVTILLPDGREVIIGPKPHLEPLPELEGRLPAGWKDAIYVRT